MLVAMLAGYMARRGDGPPGAAILAEGLKVLHALVWYVREQHRRKRRDRQQRRSEAENAKRQRQRRGRRRETPIKREQPQSG